MAATITRAQVLGFRMRAQQLDRESGDAAAVAGPAALDDTAVLEDTVVLDIGVQESGPDGGRWALAVRGVPLDKLADESADRELVTVWTIRGAPHLYRRADLPSVAAAVAPFSDADAGKRIYDAARPLKAAGIDNLAALDAVAAAMRAVVTKPTAKGTASGAVADLLDAPYLRFCRSCDATHLYEMPFRLAALRAGLELRPGTSPPVLERIADFTTDAVAQPRHDVIRAYLRLLGPATPKDVAGYLDSAVREVKARWPADAVEVPVDGTPAWVLAEDAARLGRPAPDVTRLLGPFDLFLQARDRSLLLPDAARAKAMWPVLGRPGAVLHDGDIVGMWRPRKAGSKLTVSVEAWVPLTPALRGAVEEQAERLATHRHAHLTGVDFTA
ncbi:MAG TPA: winged helix DNA-binding domain-containing protein [Pseudonocardia sp.]|nr:winged helix DNA-binding domain-containing protein [Pseudonocardia sp.]